MLVKWIASDIQLPVEFIERVSISASHRYKSYRIKKRTKGYRTIDHPARELKLLQHWMVDNLFSALPVHNAVYSYRAGRNIQGNANIHRKNNFLLRVDFADFFPSIRAVDIVKLLQKHQDVLPFRLSRRDTVLVTSIVCKDGHLTIGAPSSPIISNAILFEFDDHIASVCKSYSVKYSRYADDLYFSTSKRYVLEKVLEEVKRAISDMQYPRLRINNQKSVFTSRKRQRKVAGVTLTSENKLSIGRQRKRAIKSMVHEFKVGTLARDKASYLRGLLAFVQSIEPSFMAALEKKYGSETISEIRGLKPSSRK